MKSLPFIYLKPEKGTPFRAEPPRIGHYRESPPPRAPRGEQLSESVARGRCELRAFFPAKLRLSCFLSFKSFSQRAQIWTRDVFRPIAREEISLMDSVPPQLNTIASPDHFKLIRIGEHCVLRSNQNWRRKILMQPVQLIISVVFVSVSAILVQWIRNTKIRLLDL